MFINLDDKQKYVEPDNIIYNKNDMILHSVVMMVLELGYFKLSKKSLGNHEFQTRTKFSQRRIDKRKDTLTIVVRHAIFFAASSFSVTDKIHLDVDYSKTDEFIP